MRKIKVGQIGIGHNHGEGKMLAIRKFPELFEVVGYNENSESHLKSKANLECYRDIPRMSEGELLEKCELIIVECDVWDLTATAMRCIKAGKHVHVDKPASGTLEEYKEMLSLAKGKGLTVQLGYMYRYNHALCKLREMIKRGELGEIYQIDAEMSTYHPKEYRRWLGNFKGGSMYIFGSHLIDLILLILGEPKKVNPYIKQTGFEGVYSDDNCFALLDYEKAIARVTTLSVEMNGWGMRRFAVMGSLGTVEIKPIELDVEMTYSNLNIAKNAYMDMKEKITVSDVPRLSRYDLMVKELYESIVGIKENPYSYEHEFLLQKTLLRATGEECYE